MREETNPCGAWADPHPVVWVTFRFRHVFVLSASEASLPAFPKLCEGRTGMFHCSMQEHLWCSVLLSLGFPDDTFIGVSSCKSHGYVKQKGE